MLRIQPLRIPIALTLAALALGSCVDQEFAPPEPWDRPVGNVLTVAQLRAMFTGSPVEFQEDFSVYATVTFDGQSGNLWRSAYVQDHTAGINLRLQAPGGLYEGDSVRIFLRGTVLSAHMGMLQLDNVNVDWNIIKLATGRDVAPRGVQIPELLNDNLQGQLVRLDDVQFAASELETTFADSANLASRNRMLEDCAGNTIIVRTSGYANFANTPIPAGRGSIIAVAARFGSDFQLFVRRIEEVQLTGSRCPIPGDGYTRISIANLRQNFAEGFAQIPPSTRIEGVVISDLESSNLSSRNLVVMDESRAGMVIRFPAFHSFPLGARIRVIVAGMSMSTFNGLLQIADLPMAQAVNLGQGELPEPRQVSISEVLSNPGRYESTLVTIPHVTISGGDTFAGSRTIHDGTGQMTLFTHDWASFAHNPLPTGTVSLTGIISVFHTPQLMVRNLSDILIH